MADLIYRKNDDEQEVDVGNVVELEPDVLGHETQRRVFGGSDLVSDELRKGIALFVAGVIGQRLVEEDAACRARCLAGIICLFFLLECRLEICAGGFSFDSSIAVRCTSAGEASKYRLAFLPALRACRPLCCPSQSFRGRCI